MISRVRHCGSLRCGIDCALTSVQACASWDLTETCYVSDTLISREVLSICDAGSLDRTFSIKLPCASSVSCAVMSELDQAMNSVISFGDAEDSNISEDGGTILTPSIRRFVLFPIQYADVSSRLRRPSTC